MIRILNAAQTDFTQWQTPQIQRDEAIERAVEEIICQVRRRGDAALIEYARMLDGAEIQAVLVPQEQIERAYAETDPAVVLLLERAKKNIEDFHRRQVRQGYVIAQRRGVVLGQRVIPLRRVGLYVPGGTASYPSSVLMNAIPAKLAGVEELVIATPPGRNGSVNPAILCAARVAGVDKIVLSGGAQAVAALAYGTACVPRVDKIVGPGNVYVATAKRLVYGQVDIDMIAGPSEVLVIADGNANPRDVAADMLSQAEHDERASALLLTDAPALAEAVRDELEKQLPRLERAAIARASILKNGKIVLVRDLDEALSVANQIAPEHLELMVDEPFALLGGVKNAGSVFLGRYAPEALGDYWAGPNHTLPTSGTARFSSPLSVDDFVKTSQFLYYDERALLDAKNEIAAMAALEGLGAHARSVLTRFEEDEV